MKKKLSQKERGELVNKAYFHDTLEEVLESKNYVTKDYLRSQNYVTKDWALDMFETFQKNMREEIHKERELFREDFQRHTNSLVEMIRHENNLISEAIMSRVERIERHVGLDTM